MPISKSVTDNFKQCFSVDNKTLLRIGRVKDFETTFSTILSAFFKLSFNIYIFIVIIICVNNYLFTHNYEEIILRKKC